MYCTLTVCLRSMQEQERSLGIFLTERYHIKPQSQRNHIKHLQNIMFGAVFSKRIGHGTGVSA